MNNGTTKHESVKFVATVGVALALCLVAQLFKGIQFITGPLVNVIIIFTGLYAGLAAGLLVAVLSPVMAYFFSPAPVMQALPQMIFVVIIGNALIVLFAVLFKRKLILGLAIGVVAKVLAIWILSSFVVIPIFGSGLAKPMIEAVRVTFSVNQLITSAIGAVIICLIPMKKLNLINER